MPGGVAGAQPIMAAPYADFRNTGRLLSRQYLLEAVWGLNDAVQTRTLDIHVSQLRNLLQLADNGWRIHSVYAHGYRLETLA